MSNRSNSKLVKQACAFHVCDYYNHSDELKADYRAAGGARQLVEGGNFLISYYDQREFLDKLDLNNNSSREFSDQQVFDMYVLLVSRAIEDIVQNGVREALTEGGCSMNDFEDNITIKETDKGIYIETVTPVSKYAQLYVDTPKEVAQQDFMRFYYPLWMSDVWDNLRAEDIPF